MVCLTSLFCFVSLGGNTYPWSHPTVVVTGISFAIFLGLLIRLESRAVTPILPLVIFHRFPTRNLIFTGFLFSMINYVVSLTSISVWLAIRIATCKADSRTIIKVMYNMPTFFQTVLLESSEDASTHLVVPSISFTVVSAFTAFLISKLKSPAPTFYASQILLVVGATGLVVMATVFPRRDIASWMYNAMLILPAAGASMMAPSALMTLLSLTGDDDHAVVNGGFIMIRSLGVFMATTLSTATVQGSFRASFRKNDSLTRNVSLTILNEALQQCLHLVFQRLEEVRKNVELIGSLGGTLQTQGKSIMLSNALGKKAMER